MKKVFVYISIAAAAVLAASCSKNEPTVFDDSNAFVAFDSPTASIAEAVAALPSQTTEENMGFLPQTKTLKVPVTLGSLKGIEETVKFTIVEDEYLYKDYKDPDGDLTDKANWIDKTAHSGKNFNLLTTSGTLSFTRDARTQYIEFEVLYDPEYTGDYKFNITLSKPENAALGYNSTCVVTISDVNHPLTAMLGEYTCTSSKAARTNPWVITLKKDADDDHMVWIYNLMANSGWADDDTMFYGNVNEDKTTINIPFGQTTEYKYGGETPVTLYWMDADGYVGKTGSIDVKVLWSEDGKNITGLDFGEEYGFYCYIEDVGYVGYSYPRITAVKN